MSNSYTQHSIELRRKTSATYNEKIKAEGVRVCGGFFGDEAKTIEQLSTEHGSKMEAVRYLVRFYNANKTP